MPVGTNREKELKDKECFDLWVELGSNSRVSQHLYAEGRVNPRTGEPYHPASIHVAAMRWVIENPDEARQIYQDRGVSFAYDDFGWWDYVVKKAWTRWKISPAKFVIWMAAHNLTLEKFRHVYVEYLPMLEALAKSRSGFSKSPVRKSNA